MKTTERVHFGGRQKCG